MKPVDISNLVKAWRANNMLEYNWILSRMSAYELQETAAMLHMIARSMEMRKVEIVEKEKK